MSETQKTRTQKIKQFIREDDSGYKFVSESSSTHTDIEGSNYSGRCGGTNDEWLETPQGDRIETLEEAFEHIQEHFISQFYRHERIYTQNNQKL